MSKELLAINVNEHTEKKNNLTYLSWAWAWAEVLKIDPQAAWFAHDYTGADGQTVPYMVINGTAMVKTSVRINEIERECLLPVMDHRNKAIPNPDAFAVNTAIMRCMTKAISMHGLGLYIYAGEDLPQVGTEDPNTEAIAKRKGELEELALYLIDCHKNEDDMKAIETWYRADTWTDPDYFDGSEQRKFVWSLLNAESKLRSAIKANAPK